MGQQSPIAKCRRPSWPQSLDCACWMLVVVAACIGWICWDRCCDTLHRPSVASGHTYSGRSLARGSLGQIASHCTELQTLHVVFVPPYPLFMEQLTQLPGLTELGLTNLGGGGGEGEGLKLDDERALSRC